ncbi:nuclear transport factor 2 family protein [Rhodococcoides yunnanense]|uniref:nuclear transport factor 2 family protein n=1 Tax=Rhodococcoides yunnanense TaxID=278209 RepID=UPI0009FF76A0|nr:nuclear transport factor 2 family protein [Rhodococcus yunnanensis]
MKPVSTLEDLLDREAIRDVLTRYAHGVNRKDIDLLRTVYWPDAVEDHGTGVHSDVEEMIAGFTMIAGASVDVFHHLGLPLIRLEGETARSSTYVFCHHRVEGQSKPHWTLPPEPLTEDRKNTFQDFFMGGRYIDLMERRDGEWRIKHRKIAYDWFRVVDGQKWDTDYPFPGYENFHFGSPSSLDIGAEHFRGAFDPS